MTRILTKNYNPDLVVWVLSEAYDNKWIKLTNDASKRNVNRLVARGYKDIVVLPFGYHPNEIKKEAKST